MGSDESVEDAGSREEGRNKKKKIRKKKKKKKTKGFERRPDERAAAGELTINPGKGKKKFIKGRWGGGDGGSGGWGGRSD